MPKFAVHVHGTGCWLAFEEERGGEWTQIAPSPHGFYTVRCVETPSADEAVAKVFESIHSEVKGIYRDGYPRCIELDEVLEDPKGVC